MVGKQNNGSDQSNGESGKQEQERHGESGAQRHMNFFWDSSYQIVTWVLIALAIGFLLLFVSKENWRGVLWSGVALLCFIVIMLGLLAQKHYPIFRPSAPPPPKSNVTPSASSSGEMPKPPVKWTDYREDYFFGAIWRWQYRPEMGDKEPRNIFGYCPDCNRLLTHNPYAGKRKPDGYFTYAFYCHKHLGKHYWIRSATDDPFDGVKVLIRKKLQSGEWEDVVNRQIDVRDGTV